MAPEQFRNAKNADERCDIYSLAATLYMAVTGELPFKSCSPLDAWMKKMRDDLTPARDVVPTLSERTDWAIRRAMCHEPDQRPASSREFVEDLTGRSTKRTPPVSAEAPAVASQDMWYLYYKDEEGTPHTVKGSVYAIRRSLKEGLLGDASNIRASRDKAGPFEPLRAFPEFRDLVITPTATPPLKGRANNNEIPKPVTPASDVTTPVTTPTPVGSTYRPPHFNVVPSGSRGFDWKTWGLMALVAIATALVTFYLISGKFW
jgi:serine/threonine protein kinase